MKTISKNFHKITCHGGAWETPCEIRTNSCEYLFPIYISEILQAISHFLWKLLRPCCHSLQCRCFGMWRRGSWRVGKRERRIGEGRKPRLYLRFLAHRPTPTKTPIHAQPTTSQSRKNLSFVNQSGYFKGWCTANTDSIV